MSSTDGEEWRTGEGDAECASEPEREIEPLMPGTGGRGARQGPQGEAGLELSLEGRGDPNYGVLRGGKIEREGAVNTAEGLLATAGSLCPCGRS